MSLVVGVVGATGAVGQEMVKVLEERDFPVKELRLFASHRSKGKEVNFKGAKVVVEDLSEADFSGIQVALFSAGSKISREYAPKFVEKGATVIDNSKAFRMYPNVPLVVPEVNPEDVKWHRGIIANPNCSTIQMVVALKPIYDRVGIKRVVVSTYQAVSGTGYKAITELEEEVKAYVEGKEYSPSVYPYQIAFNALPHIGPFENNGYTEEEMKMLNETRKIIGDPNIMVSATTVRVPVFRAHSEAITLETIEKITASEVKALLKEAKGVKVVDDPKENLYPLAIDAAYKDEVFVGRIREDLAFRKGISFWVVSDNLRKGAALNAVQIAELLI